MKPLQKYIDEVLSGDYPAGKLIIQAVQRHVNDLQRNDWPYYFDIDEARRHIDFAQICRHWKGEKAGQRIVLEPHQIFRWAMLYGWKDKRNERLRFHRSLKLVARKNYKTTEAAVDAIDHLLLNPPAGAQVYAGATKSDQAMIVVNDAGKIIQRTPELTEKFKLFTFRDKVSRVVSADLDSFFAPLAKENKNSTQDGYDPSLGIIDEYHAHPDNAIYNIIESGMGNRPGWLINVISTAGSNKQGPCYSVLRDLGIKVMQGILEDDETLYLLHELDDEDTWDNQEAWIKANPRMILDPDFKQYLQTRYKTAKLQHGEAEADFKTKNLNQWVDQYNTWIADDLWQACQRDHLEADFYGMDCFAGLDLASTRDTNSLVLCIPLDDSRCVIIPYVWIPQAVFEKRSEKIDVDFRKWKDGGFIKVLPGNSIDHEIVAKDIKDISEKFNIVKLGIDPRMKDAILKYIDNTMGGFLNVDEFSQSIQSLSYPTKEFEKLIVDESIVHLGNPVMRWMLSNVAIYTDANENIKLVKNKSADKIDAVVSAVMAIGEWVEFKMSGGGKSIYETRGVSTL